MSLSPAKLASQVIKWGRQVYKTLIGKMPKDDAIHRESLRAILREATHALNRERVDDSNRWFKPIRRDRCGRGTEVRILVRRIEATYAYLSIPSQEILQGLSPENEMFDPMLEEDIKSNFQETWKAGKR